MDGFLYINKPINYTSRDVVNQVCQVYGVSKVGHTGTLDPIATGVLIVALGKGTKLIDELTTEDKIYIATAQMGILTDTLDITGDSLEIVPLIEVTKEHLDNILLSFVGTIEQTVPLYSAVRVNGRKLYEYGRLNIPVTLPKRTVMVKNIELLELNTDTFTFRVEVSKGTYIRSLIRDIGNELGIPCSMSSLCRVKQGNISLDECISLDKITKDTELITIDDVLRGYPSLTVTVDEERKVYDGVPLYNSCYTSKVKIYAEDKTLIALYKLNPDNDKQLVMDRLFVRRN